MSKGISNKNMRNIFLLFISCLTIAFLVFNTTKISGLSHKIKRNLIPRILAETPAKKNKTTKICEKTSSKLNHYFRTGDKTELVLDETNYEDNYEKEYIKALINIVKHYYDKKKNKQSKTRILGDDDSSNYKKNLLKYGLHIIPLIVVFGIGVLSLIGWIVCCCCTCFKCKCCVCKVPKCKTPSTVLALISYIIVALISFYALTEQSKIFSGLADIECSVLQFTDGVLNGETNKFPPFWAGIDKISSILNDFKEESQELNNENILTSFNIKKTDSNQKKTYFEIDLQEGSEKIDQHYSISYLGKRYQLDIAKQFGTYNKITGETSSENSICQLWLNEYQAISARADNNMTAADSSFNNIFNGNSITNDFDVGIEKMGEIKNEFSSLKELISDQIVDKADDIDKYGNLVYTLFFSILIILCASIVVFMLLLCCCSGELCTNCSCCQCFCKFFLHFFWNLMALIMFVLFMGGSLFTISGTTGGDLVTVVSYLTSENNLGQDKDTIILGNVKQYLNKCFNNNGNILDELGLKVNDMKSFEKLKEVKLQLEELKDQFNAILYKFVYSEFNEELEQRLKYNSPDLMLISTDNTDNIKFVDLLKKFNDYSDTNAKNEQWSIDSTSDNTCNAANKDETHTSQVIYHPSKCYPTVKTWSNNIPNEKSKLEDIKTLINIAGDNNNQNGMKKILNDLRDKYHSFLLSEIETLTVYINKISKITDISKNYTSEDDELFSFMNCKFVKDNVDVILYYLKNSFENDMYEVGVYLLIAAFALPFGISFTILLIMISNDEIEGNIKKDNEEKRKSIGMIQPAKIKNDYDNKNSGNSTEQRGLNPN